MKMWMKLAGTITLSLAAVWSATAAIGGITGAHGEEPSSGELKVEWPTTMEDAQFVLREYDGCVAVFAAGESEPMTMTDIPVRTLRQSDRELLGAGLPVTDRDEVLTLLEDLGS